MLVGEQIVMAPNQKFMVPLHGQGERVHQHDWGSLTITAEEMVKSKSLVEIVVRCAELDNKDLFSKSVCLLNLKESLLHDHLRTRKNRFWEHSKLSRKASNYRWEQFLHSATIYLTQKYVCN